MAPAKKKAAAKKAPAKKPAAEKVDTPTVPAREPEVWRFDQGYPKP